MPTVVFIGTFDPMHGAHIGQLLRAHRYRPFTKVTVLVNKHPTHKPHTTAWQHRIKMAELTFAALDLPFGYEIMPVENSLALGLHEPIDYKVTGIDSLIDVIGGPSRLVVAQRWPMIVLSVPGMEEYELTQVIAMLPGAVQKTVRYEYVGLEIPIMNYDFDEKTFISRRVHSTALRSGKEATLMPLSVREYIQEHEIYDNKA
jgi:nicotinic acid mononucleotide adenylyltransferase